MGTDKALLRLGDRTLLQIALDNVAAVCEAPPAIVGSRERFGEFARVVEDKIAGCGPLGGIHAALSSTRSEWNLVLSVDIPLMQPEFLRWLVSAVARNDVSAVVPKADGRLQPLCALYLRDAVSACEALLNAGKYKVDGLFTQVPTHVVSEEEFHAAGFGNSMFQNVNTREDYEQLLRRYSQTLTASSRS